MSVALVFAGGGARGAFEVGASLFLYDTYQIRPDIMCGTSVGAINVAKLAEGGTATEKRTALEELRSFWLELANSNSMWDEAEWLAELGNLQVGNDTIRDLILPAVTGQPSRAVNGDTPFIRDNFPWLLDILALAGGVYQLIVTVPPVQAKAKQGKLRSILRLRPLEDKMRGKVSTADTTTMGPRGLDSGKVRRSGVKLRLAMVSLETGALRYVTEDGRLLERDNATLVVAPTTVEQTDPACEEQAAEVERLRTIIERQYEDPPLPAQVVSQINAAKAALPTALKALEDCERVHPPGTVVVPSVDLITAVIASATMPAIFEPRQIGEEHYVDGGVREIAPVKAAFDLGGDQLEHVYVVIPSTQNVLRTPSFATADFLNVLMHSLVDLSLNEITRDDVSPAGGWPKPCDVITPSFDIYTPAFVDRGLIRIEMAYGFMCAADIARHKPLPILRPGTLNDVGVVGPQPSTELVRGTDLSPEKATQLSDAVTLLRLAAWAAEGTVHSRPIPAILVPLLPFQPTVDFAALPWIRLLKWLVKAVVAFRAQHGLPAPSDASEWWLEWENHPWGPLTPNPWAELETTFGLVAAVAFNDYRPQDALIRDPDTGAIYILRNGARIHVRNEAEFNSLGLSWADVRHMPPGVADCLPLEQR